MRQHHPRAQAGPDAHPAERTEWPGRHADHRAQPAQLENRRENLRHGVEAKRCLLESDPARLQEQYSADRLPGTRVPSCELQRAGRLRARDLADAATLERLLDRDDHARLAREDALDDHQAVIGLGDETLRLEPRRFEAVERTAQLATRALVEQCVSAPPGIEFQEAVAIEQRGSLVQLDRR